jgi:hypothetical protein
MTQTSKPMTARAYGDQTPSHVVDEFDRIVRDAVRRMRQSVDRSTLDKRQVKLLEDFGTHGKYIAGFRQVVEIARNHCQRPEDAVALADQLRGFILAGHVIDLTTPEVMLRETEANKHGDFWQFKHAYYQSRGTRDGVIEAMSGQQVASQLLADVLVRERPKMVAVR